MMSPSSSPSSLLTFADLLRHYRSAAGLTQEELAERAGLSVDAISTLERGTRRRPRKDTVALLADALALPDDERTAFAAAARRTSAAALVATPSSEATSGLDGHVPATDPASASDAALPRGVVTFLFADLEGSAGLLHQLGSERYAEVLAEVQALLRTAWAAHAGHELGTQGDHFFVVFASAEDALAAAAAAQRALAAQAQHRPDGAQVRLRMGVHAGSALLTAGRYVGLEVHRAARIAAAGHGGQVVVSGAVADQVAKFGYALPDGTSLRDLGKHRLHEVPHREELYHLVLPTDVPGLPATYPPLHTLDAWPGLRADLTAVALVSVVLVAVVGLLLALVVPAFPWVIGLGAAGLAVVTVAAAALAQPVRQALTSQWRDARKPVATVTSALLSLVVVVTTLFVTKPPIFVGPAHAGYDFSYTYHRPTHTGGAITVGLANGITSAASPNLMLYQAAFVPIWDGCVVQLPDLALGLDGWKTDQCTEVPTVDNGGESTDERTTTFHIDPHAVWSDGVPITADDFLFSARLAADHAINGSDPWDLMQLTAPDPSTVQIQWSVPYADYLNALAGLYPVPLHVYATGAFSGVYNPQTDAYDSTLAQELLASAAFNTTIPVDNGPFTVQSFVPNNKVVLVKNPRFFSNFFHVPALDQVTLVSTCHDISLTKTHGQCDPDTRLADALIGRFHQGGLDLAMNLDTYALRQLGGVPKREVVTSPAPVFSMLAFNQRTTALNAQANAGTSIFTDPQVRRAFVEGFDRCAAVLAQLGTGSCSDPNVFTDELESPSAPDYDPTFALPRYNPADAAALLTRAGFPVVDGVRRYKDGKTPLQLTLTLTPGAEVPLVLAQRMQQDYRKNLHITLNVVNDPSIWPSPANPVLTGGFDLLLFGDAENGDPVGRLGGPYDSAAIPSLQQPSGFNWFGIIDPYVDQRNQLAAQTISDVQRTLILKTLERYFAQQLYQETMYMRADVALVKPTLCNFKKWPQSGWNLWNMADWYVAPSCP